MQCPACGYVMSEFDVECERCKRLGKPQQSVPEPQPQVLPQIAPTPRHARHVSPADPTAHHLPTQPHVYALSDVNQGLAWVAACCPILAVGVDAFLRSAGIGSGWVVFAVCMVINGAILEGDRKYLDGLGLDTSSLKNAWLIPAYLFGRPSVTGGGNGYAVLWCALFILSVVMPSASLTTLLNTPTGSTATGASTAGATSPVAPQPAASTPHFQLVECDFVGDGYSHHIVGSARHDSPRTLGYAQIEFNVYDASGAQVGSTMANINNWEPGSVWKFDAIVFEDSATYAKLKDITGF